MKRLLFTILIILVLPLLYQSTPTEILKLKVFDYLVPKQDPSGYFTILNITEEDINRDGSTIALTSGKYKLTFQPGIVDDGGSTNFETKPKHFEKYPSELTGLDQILINTERLILSAKAGEMIFYSKGNYGFISDGKL